MAPCACKHTAAAVLLLAFAGAAVFLAGVSSLHSACNNDELPLATRLQLFTSAGIPSHESCAWQQGWQWWVVFGEIACLVGAAAALLCARAARIGLPVIALLAVWSTFVMPLCNAYLAVFYNLSDADYHASAWLTVRAANCCLAGTIIVSVANVLILCILGYRFQAATQDTTPATGCCKKGSAVPSPAPRATEVQAVAAAGPGQNDVSSAFIAKTEAAAAAAMV